MKKISANIMCVDDGGGSAIDGRGSRVVGAGRDDKHLARGSFQCYRFSNLGLISTLVMLLMLSSSLVVSVNGELGRL